MSADIQSSAIANGKRLICQVYGGVVSTTQTNKPHGANNSETHHNTRDMPGVVSCISS